MRVFLIGYMGVGKTTIGRKLATRLGMEFVDLDAFISEKKQKSVAKLLVESGEREFRLTEHFYLKEVITLSNVVISTGGGTPCFFDNMARMNESGVTIFLSLDPQTIKNRVKPNLNSRPLLKGKTDEELVAFIQSHLSERLPFYKQAQFSMDVSHINQSKMDELVKMISDKL